MPREIAFGGVAGKTADGTGTRDQVETRSDNYAERLLKMIPAESVALFITLEGIISQSPDSKLFGILTWSVFGICLLFTPLYLRSIGGVKKISQILITMIAFVIWALTIGDSLQTAIGACLGIDEEGMKQFERDYSLITTLLLPIFTAFVPLFYKPKS